MREVMIWHVLPELLETLLAAHKDKVEPIFKKLEEEMIWINGTWDPSLWTSKADETTVFLFLRKISTVITKLFPDLPNRIFQRPANSTNRIPDVFFAHKDAKEELAMEDENEDTNTKPNWSYYRAVAALESNSTQDTVSAAWQRETMYLRDRFQEHVTRVFAWGFTLCGQKFRFWQMDRAGPLLSDVYDISTEDGAKGLILTLFGLLSIDMPAELGLDPTMEVESSDESTDSEELVAIFKLMNVKLQHPRLVMTCRREGEIDKKFMINSVLHHSIRMVGKATLVLSCEEVDDPFNVMTVKQSFQLEERNNNEGRLLKHANEKEVPHIPHYFHHEAVMFNGTELSFDDYTRKDLIVSTRTGRPLGRFFWTRDDEVPKDKQFAPNRILNRLWTLGSAYPIWKEPDLPTLLRGFHDTIDCHQKLAKADILHRDVSMRNLLMRDTAEGGKEMFLNDYDCAISIQELEDLATEPTHTGTPLFMSARLLTKPERRHTFRHDLESFFWCFFWLICNYDNELELDIRSEFERWNYIDVKALCHAKWWWLTAFKEDFFDKLPNVLRSKFQDLGSFLWRLRNLIVKIAADMPQDQCYSELKKIFLDEAVNHAHRDDPQPPPSQQVSGGPGTRKRKLSNSSVQAPRTSKRIALRMQQCSNEGLWS